MSKNDLQYYMNLEYNIILERIESEGEGYYIAYSNELGKYACYGRGESHSEALNSFIEEKQTFIEYLFNEGAEIPEPVNKSDEKYSGVFNVRTSSIIHSSLVTQAKELDISLNLYLNQILAAAIEEKSNEKVILNKLAEICGKIDSHHFEVTKQLKYQNDSIKGHYEWSAEYCGPYLKTA